MSNIVVMKFGGTSVADAERIKRAARRIVEKREAGFSVVAVLSARGKDDRRADRDGEAVSGDPDPREMDMLLSSGERISCALCAMAINDLGHRAISLTGSQAGIVTDDSHTKARILDVRADRIRAALDEDSIVLVAGFQGVSSTAKNVTTLGRGGSDTTAVAVAAALGAEECEIYTDVPGVFTRRSADRPGRAEAEDGLLRGDARDGGLRRGRAAAALGRVRAQPRGAHPLPLLVRGRARYGCGRRRKHDGAAPDHSRHALDRRGRVTLVGVPDEPGAAARIFEALARGKRERRHDRPERAHLRRWSRGDLLHGSARRPALARVALEPLAGEAFAD